MPGCLFFGTCRGGIDFIAGEAAAMTASSVARAAQTEQRSSLVVYKFGGAALRDGAAIRHAAALVAERVPAPTVVVASALAGVTDELLDVAHRSAAGDTVRAEIARFRERHLEVADEVVAGNRVAIRDAVVAACDELEALASELRLAGTLYPQLVDVALARGERLATQLLAAALDAAGVPVSVIDATTIIHTDGTNGHAVPHVARTTRAARRTLRPLLAQGVVPLVPGFIGRASDGAVVTLGRGGSDLTATLLARALDARQTILWKDVPGILTADPHAVPSARLVPHITAREAAALAAFGAKVLHPRSLVPLTRRTRLWIRPFACADEPGTGIAAHERASRTPVKAIAASSEQALITIVAGGFAPLADLTAKAYAALGAAGLMSSISGQTSAEHTITLLVRDGDAVAAEQALRWVLGAELAAGEIAEIVVRRHVVTIGIVGRALASKPDLAKRAFGALAGAGIVVIAGAQRPSDAALSLVIDGQQTAEAQRVLHAAFQLDKAGGGHMAPTGRTDVVLLGVGAIGRELLAQVAAAGRVSPLRVCAVVDRSGYVFDARGLSRGRLVAVAAAKVAKRPLAELRGGCRAIAGDALAAIADHALVRPVLVDATAAETSALLETALARGWDVVLANKLPLAGEQVGYDRLRCTATARGREVLHEATVGAGLPVIDTLRKLQEAGDRVLRIEGCPSGTLGFLFGELGRGHAFSDAVRRAVRAGYTEPDPRIDLSGADVARKALILARLIGFRGSLDDVSVESLIPDSLRDIPLADFLARLEELDEPWHARVATARARGKLLRYRARVTRRSIDVGLVAVDSSNALGTLDGTDNQFAFTTTRYRVQPLVITGPGAGPAVTAAGVYNDLLRLAAERGGGTL
jgi:bifunctional aspartokinase / homoserine dehydrogenase 1